MYYETTFPSPVGLLTLSSDGERLTGIWLEGQKYFCRFGNKTPIIEIQKDDLPIFQAVKAWLVRYFAGEDPDARDIPLCLLGSKYQKAVWALLLEIPYGKTMTYGEIAHLFSARTGKKTSARAVGGAVGRNPISIIIPCHRVVGAGGKLTGYAGGIERKTWLLAHEGIVLT